MDIWVLIITGIVIAGIGGGGFYIIWLFTRPRKMTWIARVYQLGEGIKPPIRNDKGEILSDIKLVDLKPYCKDVIERLEKAKGITIYRLQLLNKVTPAVTQDVVDYWGVKDKEVSVLIDGDTCTLLKKGYDKTAGEIFTPMPHDRSNMIREELAIAEDRIKKPKDILEAITPWIVTGICIMGLVGIAYFEGNAWIESSKHIEASQKYSADKFQETTRMYLAAMGKPIPGNFDENIIKKEAPPVMNG